MSELLYLSLLAAVVLFIGYRERQKLDRHIDKIPTRILVNGVRGKSTVTRLIMGILREDNQRVAGKTTGTSPRLFYWDKIEEEPITRSLQGPNISEQKIMTKKVASRGVDAFVTECMAVNPEYQDVFEKRFVKPSITIITNVVEDHLDVMGPTIEQIAEAFARTIPKNGYVIMPKNDHTRFFKKAAEARGSQVIIAETTGIEESYLKEFPYMMFAENAAIGFAVADILGIDRTVARQGMLRAPVDPGAMRVHQFGEEGQKTFFFNGFAANDATSTLNIWQKILDTNYPATNRVVMMNCRDDRVDRTIQFAKDVLPHMEIDTLILTGKSVSPILDAHEEGKLQVKEIINLEKKNTGEVMRTVHTLPASSIIYGIGNIHGGGQEIANAMEKLDETEAKPKLDLPSLKRRSKKRVLVEQH
ncbi:poly-gamma-glutamate synthase PgsB [Paenalkalicoccus suaedae]|uniref:Poly-gamma-glutamate synthase PgsB n=1 Tax=Paenalkalicoccus suaedae TaxID=2592382 RepID=A0A859FA40_9BACI|nr:poly-gamma-glutamate synthase PgsB [Paenalkalicoccus suaedae]QKS70103.1 poly-gamma-glutamate synthase PgsB [Paenalkalicoccus suaedae]